MDKQLRADMVAATLTVLAGFAFGSFAAAVLLATGWVR